MIGQIADAARTACERGAELVHVAEGLEDESVHAALEQALAPAARTSRRASSSDSLAERLDPDAERADRAEHRGARRRPPRGPAAAAAALIRSVSSASPYVRQLERVGAEGVGLEQLGAGPDVLAVDVPHEVGLPEVQLVVADVEEHAAAVEHRAHRPVHHVDAAVGQQIAQRAARYRS